MSDDPFKPISGGARTAPTGDTKPTWTAILPVPEGAPAPPREHYKRGAPSATWEYLDANGRLLHLVARFDEANGKVVLPLAFCRSSRGATEWRWQSVAPARPLYGLDRLAARPEAIVVVTEGEKAADAAVRFYDANTVTTTSSGGSKAAGKADWSPLAGRNVILWPDADEPGTAYLAEAAKRIAAAGARAVYAILPPAGVAEGWDAADAAKEGWSTDRVQKLQVSPVAEVLAKIRADKPVEEAATPAARKRRTPQRDELIGLTEFCELWHDTRGEPFVTMPVNGHKENWPIRSTRFSRWLSNEWFEETKTAIGSQAREDTKSILEARACNVGPNYKTWTRVGREGDRIYLDLGDPQWRAVEIDGTGWRIVKNPPLKFLRSPQMEAIPDPEAGGFIEELRSFVNVHTDEDFTLLLSWIVASLRERGPYPVLILNGEQGSGKSGVSKLLRMLVDPAHAPIRAAPREDRDLVVAAENGWVVALDNLSTLPAWLSDALCRLATDGGFATRMLHTDREEASFRASRPIILNGIPLLAERPDLADRAITLHLPAIPEEMRGPEEDFWLDFEASRPRILGALLDAVSAALRRLPTVKLARAPRLADFAKWITAAEPRARVREPGSFLAIYGANRRDVSDSAFEADPVAGAVKAFVETEFPYGWHGSATELLDKINARTPEGIRKSKVWPGGASSLGNRIVRIAPLLRGKGFTIEQRHSGTRTISIVPPSQPAG